MTKLNVAIIETLLPPKHKRGFSSMAITKWRPALTDSTDKIVWRGDLYETADEAREIAVKKKLLAALGMEISNL